MTEPKAKKLSKKIIKSVESKDKKEVIKTNNFITTPLSGPKPSGLKNKSKSKSKKKPNIQITRTIDISSLVTDCVYDVENRIQSYADNNDIQFSKDEITKIMKAIKEQLK